LRSRIADFLLYKRSEQLFKASRSEKVIQLKTQGPSRACNESKEEGSEQVANAYALLTEPVKQFRGGLVFEAYRLLYHSTPGLRVIKTPGLRVIKVGAGRECLRASHGGCSESLAAFQREARNLACNRLLITCSEQVANAYALLTDLNERKSYDMWVRGAYHTLDYHFIGKSFNLKL